MRKNLVMVLAVMGIILLGTSSFAGNQPEAMYGDGANQFSLATGSPGELGLGPIELDAPGQKE